MDPKTFDRWELLLDMTELVTAAFHRIMPICSVKGEISFYHMVMLSNNI